MRKKCGIFTQKGGPVAPARTAEQFFFQIPLGGLSTGANCRTIFFPDSLSGGSGSGAKRRTIFLGSPSGGPGEKRHINFLGMPG